MKIATMVRAYIKAPRPADIVYAPIDIAMAICEGLALKGHGVDFYGPQGSSPPANLKTLGLQPIVHNQAELQDMAHNADLLMRYVPAMWDNYYVRDMFEAARRGEYDLLHFHHPEVALPFASLYPDVPVVYTLHDPIDSWTMKIFEMYKSPNQFVISVSDNQRKPADKLPYVATVYNGIHLKDYEFSPLSDDYLLYSGRIVPEKGVAEAVQVARQTKNKLLIVGPIFSGTQAYFNKRIKPYLNEDIKYIGYLERQDVAPYMQHAKALLMPIKWEEPFGVSMVEAMACGTPVIGMRRGSVPEVIKDGVTGFVVDTMAGMRKAVNNIDSIDRKKCHDYAAEHFSAQTMVDGYEAAFQEVLRRALKH